jgi:hypothetical protein
MKTNLFHSVLILAATLICFVFLCGNPSTSAQSPNWLWAQQAGGSSFDYGNSCASDVNGNIIAAGQFYGTVSFGTTVLTSAGNADMFLVKYGPNGNVIWAKSEGGSLPEQAYSCATDANGDIIAAGQFASATLTIGTTVLTNAGSYDILVVKYDHSGNVLWAISAGGNAADQAYCCTTDASGNIIVTGWFQSPTITFGTTVLTNGGSYDMFIVKYDPNGNVLWANSAGGTGVENGYGCSADANGNIIASGSFRSPSITFGTTVLTNAGNYDNYLVKYDPNGNVVWANGTGGNASDEAYSCTADPGGNIIATGWFQSPTITFGTTVLTNAGNADMFIVKYDPSGNVLWAQSAGGSQIDGGKSCSTDASGNIVLCGSFSSPSISFSAITLTNAGNSDIYLVKYDPWGNVLWAKSVGGSANESMSCCAFDMDGHILTTGNYESSGLSFGSAVLSNSGFTDIYVAKLDSLTTPTGITVSGNAPRDILIFPNPASGELEIANLAYIQYIEIADALGKVVLHQQHISFGDKQMIDISHLPPGLYFVKLTAAHSSSCRKLIVARN